LLAGLEVKGLGDAPSLPPTDALVELTAWSRPTGKSIVFASANDTALEKAHLDGTPVEDVNPLEGATYLNVTYHPSGLAFAFAVQRGNKESIWLSSNTGQNPKRLVFSVGGTKFGTMAFDEDGVNLYYAATHSVDQPALHFISLKDPTTAPAMWVGDPGQRIFDVRPGPDGDLLAWTVGTSCDDSVVMVRREGEIGPLLTGETRATRAVGWLDQQRLLVATGGCDGPFDLAAVDVGSGSAATLVFGVDAAATRAAVPTPPPPLPASVVEVGSGVG
jgi:hypothetical protein